MTIYQINVETLAELARIRANTNLTDSQRQIELKNVELSQLRANTAATGQELPPEPPQPAPTPPRRTYTIQPGDNAAVVSMIYGVPVNVLRSANPNVDFSRLRPGTQLVIPRTSLPPTPLEQPQPLPRTIR
jgi:LysM repeat protein